MTVRVEEIHVPGLQSDDKRCCRGTIRTNMINSFSFYSIRAFFLKKCSQKLMKTLSHFNIQMAVGVCIGLEQMGKLRIYFPCLKVTCFIWCAKITNLF